MAITRTAKGTASDKSSGLTLTISSLQLVQYTTMFIGIVYDTGQGAPVVTWGGQTLTPRESVSNSGIITAVYIIWKRTATATNDLVATWTTTAPTAKAMFATQVASVRRRDVMKTNTGTSTTPGSGALQTTNWNDEIFFGIFGSEGPSGDDAGTPASSYSSGQRVGTTGGDADTNVTIHETFKIVTSTDDTRARKTSVTSRDWVVILCTLKPIYLVTADSRVTINDVESTSQAAADTLIDNDIMSRYPDDYNVEIL